MSGFSARNCVWVTALFCLCQAGCDAVYRVQQPVLIEVNWRDSGRVAEGVHVDFALACSGDRYKGDLLSNEECIKRIGGLTQTTDQNGCANLLIDSWFVCGGLIPGLIPGPDLKADRVTGETYLLKPEGENGREYIETQVFLNHKAIGKYYEVAFLSIGSPSRIPLSD